MTAADIRWGRGAGRRLHPDAVVEGLVEPVPAVCPHGDRWLVAPSAIGTPCWRDGKPLVLAKEPAQWKLHVTSDILDRARDRVHGPGGPDQPAGTRWSSLADWWPLPSEHSHTVTLEQYCRGDRPS